MTYGTNLKKIMMTPTIKFRNNFTPKDFIKKYLELWSITQPNEEMRLTNREIALATLLINSENENPFHGSERKKIMKELNMQSANFTVFLKALISKGIINHPDPTKREYFVNPHFAQVLNLFYDKLAINITFEFENNEKE